MRSALGKTSMATHRGALVATALLALLWGHFALARPALALGIPFGVLAAIVLMRINGRYIVAGLIVFLPIQELALTHAHGVGVILIRYGPELIVDGAAVVLLATYFRIIRDRLGQLALPLGLVLMFWTLTAVWNAVSASTALIGLRGELRFLPLAIFPLVSRTPFRDARLYGGVLVIVGAFQGVVALVEFVGGTRVRELLAPQYEIVLGGVSVGQAGPPLAHVFGTFGHRNLLGVFLALAWIVLAAAGGRRLGFPPRVGVSLGVILVAGVVVSASREGALALMLGMFTVALMRFGRSVGRAAIVGVSAVAVIGLWTAPESEWSGRLLDANPIVTRWQALFTSAAWSPETNFRLRLLLENADLTEAERPIFGFGIGTMTDPRLLADYSSPVYRNFPGMESAVRPFLSDGNWAILVLEVGFVGTALLALLFAALMRFGLAARHYGWPPVALVATVPAIIALGFFTSVLQQRPASAVLWLLVGLTARTAAAYNETPTRREQPAERPIDAGRSHRDSGSGTY